MSSSAEPHPEVSVDGRVLPLKGGFNFRDLGGYRTEDGRQVRWGRIFRSGTMGRLTTEDFDYLARMGIRSLCDFRTTHERDADPNQWAQQAGLSYWARDYNTGMGELRRMMADGLASVEEAREAMIAGYRALPFEQAESYRELFHRIAAGEIPLVFNCSAGKDRAGTAAALLLSALGVPRRTVIADYAISEQLVDYRRMFPDRSDNQESSVAKMPREIVGAILRSDPDYIRAGLDSVEQRHGSVVSYLRDALEVSESMLRDIRGQLLE